MNEPTNIKFWRWLNEWAATHYENAVRNYLAEENARLAPYGVHRESLNHYTFGQSTPLSPDAKPTLPPKPTPPPLRDLREGEIDRLLKEINEEITAFMNRNRK